MLEGLSAGKSVDGLSGLLSRPFYFIFEISTALVPGLLFLLLMLLKQNATVLSIAQTSTLGYKTKLVVGLFVSYFLGKIFAVPFPLIIDALVYPSGSGKSEAKQFLDAFLGGAIALPALMGESKGIDYVMVAISDSTFHFTTGMVLIVASVVPGDGTLRPIELTVGFLMLLASLRKVKEAMHLIVSFVGLSTVEWLAKKPLQEIMQGLKIAVAVTQAVAANKPVGAAQEAKPDTGVAPTLPPQAPNASG